MRRPGPIAGVERRPFGKTGVDVARIGQGTWQVRDKRRGAEAIRAGLEAGMTHVDTAELYTGSEAMLRDALAGRRDEVFLVSKVLPRNASYKGTLAACEASLARLGTDHLDAYLLHWRTDDHPLEDAMRALGELVDRGKVRAVGVSNFDVADLEEAQSHLGRHALACNQVLYHLEDRGIEADVLPWCKAHGVALVGYSPFGSTGGFPSPRSPGGKVLHEMAARLGKTPRQVALAFLTRDRGTFAIPKSEDASHTKGNAGGDFALPSSDVAALDEAFPVEPGLRLL